MEKKMNLSRDLTGQRFGRWTVLDNYIEYKNRQGYTERKWRCQCECGTERYVQEHNLIRGQSKSCGCIKKESRQAFKPLDLHSKTFGELTVLEKLEERSPTGGLKWRCRCSCGEEYVVCGNLLTSGRVTHCNKKDAHRHLLKYKTSDITGQKIGRLTALYPTEKRSKKSSVIWHCRCDCGNEVDVSHNELMYGNVQSCGCQKKELDQKMKELLTHVAGTSVDMIKSKKLSENNTTGYRGVYYVRGKYMAKIVFQRKQYQLGMFSTPEDAANARKEAEELLFDGTAEYYARWQKRAEEDPEWAKANPVSIQVSRDSTGDLTVNYSPLI